MRRKDREVTEKCDLEAILEKCKTCHVAMVDKGQPYIVPLSFGYKFVEHNNLELYFHSALEGKKIDILKRNNNVCFEISCEGKPVYAEVPCNSGYYYSSIIGYGEIIFINDIDEKCEALSAMFKHQSGMEVVFTSNQVENICVYKIISKDFTGKEKKNKVSI